jgi:hypothetical protein
LVSALALIVALTTAAGCSSVLSEMPHQMGGLPEGTPARAETPPAYPAVHDMPPKRAQTVLSEQDRKKLEADLAAARDGAARRAAEAEAKAR